MKHSRLGDFRSGFVFLEDEKNIGHLSMDVNDGEREKLLMPLSNEFELSITAGKPSALGLFIIIMLIITFLFLINEKPPNDFALFYCITNNYNNIDKNFFTYLFCSQNKNDHLSLITLFYQLT